MSDYSLYLHENAKRARSDELSMPPPSTIPNRKRRLIEDEQKKNSFVNEFPEYTEVSEAAFVDEEDDATPEDFARIEEEKARKELAEKVKKARAEQVKKALKEEEAKKRRSEEVVPPKTGHVTTEASKEIENLGFRHASYYRNKTLMDGIMRKKLGAIHAIIEKSCSKGSYQASIPVDLVDANIRTAAQIQGVSIAERVTQADCVCGETPCEGEQAGCVVASYSASWL